MRALVKARFSESLIQWRIKWRADRRAEKKKMQTWESTTRRTLQMELRTGDLSEQSKQEIKRILAVPRGRSDDFQLRIDEVNNRRRAAEEILANGSNGARERQLAKTRSAERLLHRERGFLRDVDSIVKVQLTARERTVREQEPPEQRLAGSQWPTSGPWL